MAKSRSILITGGAGFIGSHLLARLLPGNDVTVLDNFSSGKMEHLAPYMNSPNFHLIEADLLTSGSLEEAASGKDMIFHLAANPDVRLGESDSRVHLDQNVIATYNLLEAMRKAGTKRIAFTSTSTVYGEAAKVPTPEDYGPLLPISLYGASKLACEALVSAYCHTFDMQSWIYRFANIVGERGTHGVIVDFIRKLQEDPRELEILGSGRQKKSYLEVRDCVDAMLHCLTASEQVNVFNIGSEDSIDVTEIADAVVREMGLANVSYSYTGGREGRGWKGDVRVMQLSIDRVKKTGWKPETGSAGAIETAVKSLLRGT
jgi:UDP-glucose 4-epimerase